MHSNAVVQIWQMFKRWQCREYQQECIVMHIYSCFLLYVPFSVPVCKCSQRFVSYEQVITSSVATPAKCPKISSSSPVLTQYIQYGYWCVIALLRDVLAPTLWFKREWIPAHLQFGMESKKVSREEIEKSATTGRPCSGLKKKLQECLWNSDCVYRVRLHVH